MNVIPYTHQQLSEAIEELPADILPELFSFIEYLRFKTNLPRASREDKEGATFLRSIAEAGFSEENHENRQNPELRHIGKKSGEPRPFGLCKGEFHVPDDFDAPLPEHILDAFEGK